MDGVRDTQISDMRAEVSKKTKENRASAQERDEDGIRGRQVIEDSDSDESDKDYNTDDEDEDMKRKWFKEKGRVNGKDIRRNNVSYFYFFSISFISSFPFLYLNFDGKKNGYGAKLPEVECIRKMRVGQEVISRLFFQILFQYLIYLLLNIC